MLYFEYILYKQEAVGKKRNIFSIFKVEFFKILLFFPSFSYAQKCIGTRQEFFFDLCNYEIIMKTV